MTRLAQVGFDADGAIIDDGRICTRATLNGILKYLRSHGENAKKWGYYSSEASIFEWAREETPVPKNVKTLEAQIMDWADDITGTQSTTLRISSARA